MPGEPLINPAIRKKAKFEEVAAATNVELNKKPGNTLIAVALPDRCIIRQKNEHES